MEFHVKSPAKLRTIISQTSSAQPCLPPRDQKNRVVPAFVATNDPAADNIGGTPGVLREESNDHRLPHPYMAKPRPARGRPACRTLAADGRCRPKDAAAS